MRTLFLTLVLATALTAHAQQAPTLIPFQGRLTDQAGTIYTNGQFTLIFNLYDQAVGGGVLWTETHQQVGVINGTVNVFLGSINSALTGVEFSQIRYLGITIDPDNNPNTPDPEMVPRQMILPAFWAKRSDESVKLNGYSWGDLLGHTNPTLGISGSRIQGSSIQAAQLTNGTITGSKLAPGAVTADRIAPGTITSANLSPQLALDSLIPPGTINAFAGETIPAGWLVCDGRAVRKVDYPRLFTAIGTAWGNGTSTPLGFGLGEGVGFNLPDLRGVFLRGVNRDRGGVFSDLDAAARENALTGGNVGPRVGTFQRDAIIDHLHGYAGRQDPQLSPINFGGSVVAGSRQNTSSPETPPGMTNVLVRSETRPRNAAVNYIIKE